MVEGKSTRKGRGSPGCLGCEDQSLEECRASSEGAVETYSSPRRFTKSAQEASRLPFERLCFGVGAR